MPIQMRCAFFYAKSRTLVHATGHRVVALRFDGKRVTKVGDFLADNNRQLGMSRAGVVSFQTSDSMNVVDIAAKTLRSRKVKDSTAIAPDGRLVAWRYNDDGAPDDELFSVAARGPADRRTLWRGKTDSPRLVNPMKVGAKPGKVVAHRPIQFPELVLADDGVHWAAVEARRVVIGAGNRAFAVCFPEKLAGFQPARAVFDVPRKRLLIAGPGITALSLDGKVLAASKLEVRSVPVIMGDDLVVVRCHHHGHFAPADYEVVRLDPTTLKLRGPVAGLPTRKESPDAESAVVSLGGDALAWSLGDAPVMVHGLDVEPSELVEVAGRGGSAGVVAPPRASERQLAAKTFLDELIEKGAHFGTMLREGAFAPYADQVAAWPDERIARLQTVARSRDWWQITAGASDATVDALAAAVRAGTTHREVRFRMLVGADTDHALEAIGRLAKSDKALRAIAVELDLAFERGRAIRRFAPGGFDVVAGRGKATAGLDYLRDPKTLLADARGAMCDAAPFHLLGVDLALLPGKPLAKSKLKTQHLFMSGCEDCDEWAWYFTLRPHGRKLAMTSGGGDGDRCPGSTSRPSARRRLRLLPPGAAGHDGCGRVGGRPDWVQSPDIPACPDCGVPMFFVAQANMYSVMGNLPSGTVFSFHCERCSVAVQLLQCT